MGYTFLVNNGPISWASYKQNTVATSTMEAEYMALSDAAHEAIARSHIFEELGIETPAPAILCDCQPALAIVDNPTNYQRAKHIELRYHHVRHVHHDGLIALGYVPSKLQPADILTKALNAAAHHRCI